MRTAFVQNGVVVNVVEASAAQIAADPVILIGSSTANIGDTYASGVFTPPSSVPNPPAYVPSRAGP